MEKEEKRDLFTIKLGALLIFVSAILYLLHYAIFRDYHHIFLYLIGDIAFLPIEVLFVTIIIDRLLERREKEAMMTKMNMVIGTFYSEVGTRLLRDLSGEDKGIASIRETVLVNNDWTAKDVLKKKRILSAYQPELDGRHYDLGAIKDFLLERREFLLRLLENPNLLEHESFSDLLWAVFHLADELRHRERLDRLPDSDLAHLTGDIKRAYLAMIREWVDYMRHLKDNYPYLFSLAIRSHPFDPKASIIVTE
jgi:hypothetical protein